MSKSNAVKFLLSVALLAGCVSDKYEPLKLAEKLGADAERAKEYAADRSWWKLYENPELDRLVELALDNNPDYLKAAINVNKALYNLNIYEADLFPTLEGGLEASTEKSLKGGHWKNSFSGEAGLSYEIDLYGKIRDAVSAQEFEYKATQMDRDSAKLALINSVVDLYFNLEYLSNSIDLSKANVEVYRKLAEISRSKYSEGRVSALEPAEAERSLLNEQNSLIELQTQFREMEQSLRNVLNIKPGEPLDLRYSDILSQRDAGVDLDVPMSVLENRPDLAASQYRLEKAFRNLKAEDKSWYPSVTILGSISSQSEKIKSTFDVPYTFGSVSVSLPFLDWTTARNNIRISEADYQESLLDFKDALNKALNEVAYYYYAYAKSRETFDNIKQNLDCALKIAKYYKSRYDRGKSEFKDFLEALGSQNSAKSDLIRQKYQIIKYENYIYKAMAGRYSKLDRQGKF